MKQFQIHSQFRGLGYLIFLLPLLEIAGFILVGHWLGVMRTIGLILLTSFCGILLMKPSAGALSSQNPMEQLVKGGFSKISGILLFLPGFFTDCLGLLLLVPAVRAVLLKRLLKSQMKGFGDFKQWQQPQNQSKSNVLQDDDVIEGEFWQDKDQD